VRPALGKTNAHQFRVKLISLMPAITDTVEMQKNQNENSKTNVPDIIPRTLTT
jgi:hypothetical protein